MISNLLLCAATASVSWLLWGSAGISGPLSYLFAGLALWQGYSALATRPKPKSPPILRLGGFSWQLEDFCRGWLITGQVGSGKTNGAINAMLWQVSRNCPNWGGVCVDDKGLYWETLSQMMRELGREKDLVLLQVRPPEAPPEWLPTYTFNFLNNPHLPYSALAKIVCDVAASLGQRSDQSFFKVQAQVQIEFAFRALNAAGMQVTLQSAYELININEEWLAVKKRLDQKQTVEAKELLDHHTNHIANQPAEQLGGVKSTISNYLKYFTDRAIAEVFCPGYSSFNFDDIDRGKIVCVSIPQRYQTERRYIVLPDESPTTVPMAP